MLIETYEQLLTELQKMKAKPKPNKPSAGKPSSSSKDKTGIRSNGGRLLAGVHDTEFDRHLGMQKAHMFHAPHRKELVHMYTVGKQTLAPPKPKKPGEKPTPKPNRGVTLKAMMKYHGYKSISPKDAPRQVYSRDEKNKYHEVHVDLDKKGEPRAIYHKERFQ